MHICFVFHREYPATHSTAIQNYADTLTDLGHDVSGIFARRGDEPTSERINDVSIHRIDSDPSSAVSLSPTRFGWGAMRKLREIHDQSPADVVHLHAFPGLGAVLDTPRWAPPTVVDVRGTAVRNAVFEAASRLGLVFQRRIVDEMAVVSERVAEHIFLSTEGLSILPLGANVEAFATATGDGVRGTLTASDDELLLGFVGGLHESRELDALISAYAEVDEPATRLVIIGDGRDRDRLEAHATSIGVEEGVTFTGSIPHSEVPSYLTALDIGLAWIPDRPQYRNQPPLKTVEYLAAQLPVIATPTPGNLEFCSEQNSLISSFDVGTFGADLERLVQDESLRRSIASRAAESVAEYDYENIVRDRLLPIYHKAMERNSSSESNVSLSRESL